VTLRGWGGWAILGVCIGCGALRALAEEAHGGRKWRCGTTSLPRAEAGRLAVMSRSGFPCWRERAKESVVLSE